MKKAIILILAVLASAFVFGQGDIIRKGVNAQTLLRQDTSTTVSPIATRFWVTTKYGDTANIAFLNQQNTFTKGQIVDKEGTSTNLLYLTNDKNATLDSTVVVTATGNVGIGTTAPYHLLSSYKASPVWALTNTTVNLNVTSAAQAIDSSAIALDISGEPTIKFLALDGDAGSISINSYDQEVHTGFGGGYKFLNGPILATEGGVIGTGSNGYLAFGAGEGITASGGGSIGLGSVVTSGGSNYTVGIGHFLTANAENAHVIGRGVNASNRLSNTTENTLKIGYNSTAPTLTVTASAGGSTTGFVQIPKIQQPATDTTGIGSTANIGTTMYYNGHFYGLKAGSPPVWVQLDN